MRGGFVKIRRIFFPLRFAARKIVRFSGESAKTPSEPKHSFGSEGLAQIADLRQIHSKGGNRCMIELDQSRADIKTLRERINEAGDSL
ncbi:MAG: hypothetical protein LBN04_06350 [Oscillospiraceae bacterium]|jgi:hypothetical protein|nr:hypothetical protein [Oscillospiraceae bacterium]